MISFRPIRDRRHPLAFRFTALVGLLLLAFAGVFMAYNTLSAQRTLTDEVQRHATYLGKFTSDLVDEDIQSLSLKELHQIMQEFSRRPDIRYARLLDRYRRIISDGVNKTAAFSAVSSDDLFDKAEASHKIEMQIKSGTLNVAQPILVNGELVGVLGFGLSLAALENETNALIRRNLVIIAAFLLLAMPLISIVVKQATAPILRLTDASRKIAEGDLNVTFDTRSADEVGDLARSMARMVSSLSKSADEIRLLTFSDPVTGLPNRAQLEARLSAAIEDSATGATSVVLALVNLDRFGRLNQTLGKDVGDQVLREVATRLEAAVHEWRSTAALKDGEAFETVVARLAGDDYAIMLAGKLDDDHLSNILRRFRRVLEPTVKVGDELIAVKAAVGLARSPQDAQDVASLERNARIALQAAKAEGAGTHRFFSTEQDAKAFRRLSLEADLRRAVMRGDLDVHFQPQVSCTDRSCRGAEALVRWKHPVHGSVSPVEFIAIAEESDLIIDIGTFVLRRVCAQGAHWAKRGLKPRLSVNVSRAQFLKPDFTTLVLDTLLDTGMDPSCLELEVTESVAIGDPDAIAASIAPLRAAGVRLAIDDFGVGYSSLSVLTRLPFDVLKIDRSFITHVDTSEDGRRLVVQTMLAMAHGLGLEVVAEGIEREEELAFLREGKCDLAQGYLFSRPVPAETFEPWYITHRPNQARDLQRRMAEAMNVIETKAA